MRTFFVFFFTSSALLVPASLTHSQDASAVGEKSRIASVMNEAERKQIVTTEQSPNATNSRDWVPQENQVIQGAFALQAGNSISLGGQHTFTVARTGVVVLHAKNVITIGPGFTVEEGGVFSATVDDNSSPSIEADAKKEEPASSSLRPTVYSLSGNYPNPFNPSTVITYALPEEARVSLKIFNTLGQEVKTILDEIEGPGYKSVTFDARSLPSGVYFYRLQAGTFSSIKKMVLMK